MAPELHVYDGSAWRKIKDLYVSGDGVSFKDIKKVYCHDGISWRLVFAKLYWERMGYRLLTGYCLAEIDGVMYVATQDGILYYSNSTDSWSFLGSIRGCFFVGEISGAIFIGTTSGAFYWSGSTWVMLGTLSQFCSEIIEFGGDIVLALAGGVYYWSGSTLVLIGNPGDVSPAFSVSSVGGVLHAVGDGKVYFKKSSPPPIWEQLGTISNAYNIIDYGGIPAVSTPNGVYVFGSPSWTRLGSAINARMVNIYNGILYASTSNGIYKYSGSDWERIGSDLGQCYYSLVASNRLWCGTSDYWVRRWTMPVSMM